MTPCHLSPTVNLSSLENYFRGIQTKLPIYRALRTAAMAKERRQENSAQPSRKKQKLASHAFKAVDESQPGIDHISLDQLHWKEVSLPLRFEDAEGFFGLEEIEGVDVTRDTTNGKVKYRVGKDS